MNCRRRIAIYGGTFDPVHRGHLAVARRITELFEIDDLQFVPAEIAPHKLNRVVTPAMHRYAMLVLATQDDIRLRVSTFELEAANRRYTVDTLAHFQKELAGSADLFFIMGADSWSEIATWREWERLLQMVNHIVVTRPGFGISFDHIGVSLRSRIVDLRQLDRLPADAKAVEEKKIFITDAVMLDISATEIRRAAKEESLEELIRVVPASVAHYIRKYELYKDSNEA